MMSMYNNACECIIEQECKSITLLTTTKMSDELQIYS